VAIITFGTAWVYEDIQTGLVVDNCRKRPASDFLRRRLTVEEIVNLWQAIIHRYADRRFIFTVSPIRHIKDGLHENQLSKAILLLAIEKLINNDAAIYFPSYELLQDELRDYRFYASDMLHPSETAVEYIFERFADTFLYDTDTRESMRSLHQLYLDRRHRPLHPESEEYQQFQAQRELRARQLRQQFPWLN